MVDPNTAGTPVVAPIVVVPDPIAPAAANVAPIGAQPDAGKTVPLPALHEARDEIRALKAEMDMLRSAQEQQTQMYQQPQQQVYQQPQQNPMAQIDELWETDPRQAFRAEMTMALNWRDEVDAHVDIQEDACSKKFTDFETYRKDVKRHLRTIPVAQRGKNGMVELAYYLVKGQNAGRVAGDGRVAAAPQFAAAAQGVGGGSVGTVSPTNPNQLTEAEVKTAQAMGLTNEQYLAGKR